MNLQLRVSQQELLQALLLNLEFVISADEITRVSSVKAERKTELEAEPPILQHFTPPFIRVQTDRDGLLNNFLVCVGASGLSMKKTNAQSSELLQNLEEMIVAK